jgi:hypothetical protein
MSKAKREPRAPARKHEQMGVPHDCRDAFLALARKQGWTINTDGKTDELPPGDRVLYIPEWDVNGIYRVHLGFTDPKAFETLYAAAGELPGMIEFRQAVRRRTMMALPGLSAVLGEFDAQFESGSYCWDGLIYHEQVLLSVVGDFFSIVLARPDPDDPEYPQQHILFRRILGLCAEHQYDFIIIDDFSGDDGEGDEDETEAEMRVSAQQQAMEERDSLLAEQRKN